MIHYLRFFEVVGRPFADIIYVILIIIRMKVFADKRKELSQTIVSLIGQMRTEMGLRRCDFCQNMEDENELCILEEWETQENLDSHLKSERFRVFRGAMTLLQKPYEMTLYEVATGKRERKRNPRQQCKDLDGWGRRTISQNEF